MLNLTEFYYLNSTTITFNFSDYKGTTSYVFSKLKEQCNNRGSSY